MLRIAVFILLLANASYFLWSQGLLAGLGLAPEQHSEPERLRQQLHPEALQLLDPPQTEQFAPAQPIADTANAARETTEPGSCLQSGILDEDQSDALRRALALQLPEGSWRFNEITQPGRWMVYMGKFTDSQALEKKRVELRALKLDNDRAGGALEPGLSLGRFSSEEAATRELSQLVRQGVRSARVVQERPDKRGFVLRLSTATPALRTQVEALPAFAGKSLRACN